jgi:hypothetical protein
MKRNKTREKHPKIGALNKQSSVPAGEYAKKTSKKSAKK